MLRWASSALLLGGLLLATGCSNDSGLVPVSGTVTLDGKPVSGVIVTFAPQGETEGNGALGYVDDKGSFTLADSRGEPGAYAGEYRVSFYPAFKKGSLAEDDPAGAVVAPTKTGLPAIYLDPYNSPVLAKVPKEGGTIEVLLTPSGKGAEARSGPRSK